MPALYSAHGINVCLATSVCLRGLTRWWIHTLSTRRTRRSCLLFVEVNVNPFHRFKQRTGLHRFFLIKPMQQPLLKSSRFLKLGRYGGYSALRGCSDLSLPESDIGVPGGSRLAAVIRIGHNGDSVSLRDIFAKQLLVVLTHIA